MKIGTEKKLAASLSIASNALIILFKIVAGVMSNSISIISEAIHSFSDFLASILTFFAVSRANEPADKSHPFGHGKYEDMSGFIEGGLIVFAGLFIVYGSISKLICGYENEFEPTLGIYAMAFSVLANFWVSTYLFYVAKKTDSVSIYADAQHLRTDIFSSLCILLGLLIIKYTGLIFLDSLIACIIAAIIIKTGYSISRTTLNNLLDGALPDTEIKKIERILNKNSSIKGYKNLKARKAGACRAIEIVIFFEPSLTIADCHKICDDIELEMVEALGDASVHIHAEPYRQ
jgi:cation diffusion facilitator family transporter